jgi:hypothetical protein
MLALLHYSTPPLLFLLYSSAPSRPHSLTHQLVLADAQQLLVGLRAEKKREVRHCTALVMHTHAHAHLQHMQAGGFTHSLTHSPLGLGRSVPRATSFEFLDKTRGLS